MTIKQLAQHEERKREMTNKHKKILLVEDDKSNRLCLHEFLKDRGYGCQEAKNGAEGLIKLQSEPFDLVITDLNMPIMNGFQLVDALAASSSLNQIPVLIVTGQSLSEVRQKTTHPLVKGVLPKPYDFPQISRSLAALFS